MEKNTTAGVGVYLVKNKGGKFDSEKKGKRKT